MPELLYLLGSKVTRTFARMEIFPPSGAIPRSS